MFLSKWLNENYMVGESNVNSCVAPKSIQISGLLMQTDLSRVGLYDTEHRLHV